MRGAAGHHVGAGYRELPQGGPRVACLWVREATSLPRVHRVLPDACVDVVWHGDGRLVVAGPATGPVLARLPVDAPTLGLRFRVAAAGGALGLPARELLDLTVSLADLWGREADRLAERVAAAPTAAAALAALAGGVEAGAVATGPDPVVRAAAAAAARPGARVERLGDDLGIGERQLRRRFARAVGYGPKTLQRILRFQRFLALSAAEPALAAGARPSGATRAGAERNLAPGARPSGATRGAAEREPDLARLALDAGYADQAHLTRECRRLAGLTPAALLAAGARPAGERTVPFKTEATRRATLLA